MIYFTVGPTQLNPIVPKAIEQAITDNVLSMSHRSPAFDSLFQETIGNLRSLVHIPSTHAIFFLSSATEAMERIVQNTVASHSYHFVNGSFAERFYKIAQELGKKPTKVEVAYGESFDWKKSTIPKNTELICFTHNETSTGVMLPVEEIYHVAKKNPQALIAVDTVSSMPYVDIDFTKVDCVFFSVQKGFGLPAGLAVIILSPRAMEKAAALDKRGISTGSYHSFRELKKYADKAETPETPNVLDIYLLNTVLKQMLKEGIDTIRKRIETHAAFFETFFHEHPDYQYLSSNPADHSKTIHVVKVPGGSQACRKHLKAYNMVVSSGYKDMKEDYIRIACFPAHTSADIRVLIKLL